MTDARWMLIDDPALPAVRHVSGEGAHDVIGAFVDQVGGRLHGVRASQVQYRPGSELVVRFRVDVTWADGRRRPNDTLLAAVSRHGTLPGTIPIVAQGPERDLTVGLWRWPFDPSVPGIELAATPGLAEQLLEPHVGRRSTREVVAYRPTERAVVRASGQDGAVVYLKALRPDEAAGVVMRHERLAAAGLPVPEVLAWDEERGLLVLSELPGTTMRERIKGDLGGWPGPDAVGRTVDAVHRADGAGLPHRVGRIEDAIGHAQMLGVVVPDQRARLERLGARFESELACVRERSGTVVHGDLHEGQLIVDGDGSVTGLLDVDDLAVGDPIDDDATLIAHLQFRALVMEEQDEHLGRRGRLVDYTGRLRDDAVGRHGASAVDVATASVLVGLATGPFRIQSTGWRETIDEVLARAAALAGT